MRFIKSKLVTAVSLALIAGFTGSNVLAADTLIASSKKSLNGSSYSFEKYMTADGVTYQRIFQDGVEVRSEPKVTKTIVDPTLAAKLAGLADGDVLKVNLALVSVNVATKSETESGGVIVNDGKVARMERNGVALTDDEQLTLDARLAATLSSDRASRIKLQAEKLSAFASRYGFADNSALKPALARGDASLTLALSAGQLRKIIDANDADLSGLELAFSVKDDSASYMIPTSINPWQQSDSTAQGSNIGLYMTESGCADPAGRTNYTRLAGSQTNHSQNVFGILRAVSPQVYIYCRGGAVLPASSDVDGVSGNPAIHVINRSNGGNTTINYSTLDRDWDNFAYDNRIAIFNAAGNEGGATNTIISPAKGINVMAVGNYDDATNAINSSSSYLDPDINAAKPEISAPGTNIPAGGFTMTGTSMASPHAAAMAADLMAKYSFYRHRPHVVNAVMIGGATDAITGGKDKVGAGGIDFLSTAYNGWHYYYQGSNSAFSSFDSGDGSSDGYITKKVYIPNSWSKVRVAIAWQNRGDYTYDHRGDAHPIGQDLDLSVYGPTGAYVGGSASWDNPYEVVNFTPSTSGTYTIKIKRFANRDSGGDFRLGLLINTYN
ncbi:MAG TPA: S8 family serine peptidase [Pseudomonadales bacterium]|nr:S8 family serine peptidase [Pseudomonadales bacterium]